MNNRQDFYAGIASGFCIGAAAALLIVTLIMNNTAVAVEEVQATEVYEPEVWRGRVECVYGNSMMYSVDNLVDFIVTAQPAGWMWEMFREDGTVILYQQPERVFCSAIPEENESE